MDEIRKFNSISSKSRRVLIDFSPPSNRFGDLNESTIAVTDRQESSTLEFVALPNFTTDVPKTTTIINGDLITATSGDSLDTSTAGSTVNDNIGKVAHFAHMTF